MVEHGKQHRVDELAQELIVERFGGDEQAREQGGGTDLGEQRMVRPGRRVASGNSSSQYRREHLAFVVEDVPPHSQCEIAVVPHRDEEPEDPRGVLTGETGAQGPQARE